MRVLVTGGTGFVGAWSAKTAVDAGHAVRFLVRDPARLETSAAPLGLDTSDHAVGDITDANSVARALDGCDAVIHSAAVVATDPGRAAEMLRTNLTGARNVLGSAADRGLDPIVHVSSFTALFRPGLEVLTADLPVTGGSDGYGRSKAAVEVYARGMQDGGAPVSITYPGMVLGPPAGQMFGEAAEGVEGVLRMGVLPGQSAAWLVVDVREVATLHASLLEPGRGPRRYLCGGHRVTVPRLAEIFSELTGKRFRVLPVPDQLLRGFGQLADTITRFLPFETPMTAAAMQYYTQMPPSDDSPSERDFGIDYRDPLATIAATIDGLKAVGRVSD
ncbi:MAG: NAD-dependent epimerase/dehydratase family protein [Acidimicrobiales bacterium]